MKEKKIWHSQKNNSFGGVNMLQKTILEVKNLHKSFGRQEVLNDVNFSVECGKIVGLLGKNGAGKTTLMKIIIGLLKNYQGEIYYDGSLINHQDVLEMNTIGSLVDTTFYEDLSAHDNMKIAMMATPGKNTKGINQEIEELLHFVGLIDNIKDKVKTFSFGMKQRLALAQALTVDPKLLILDEPFVGLDPLGIALVKDKLKSLCEEKNVSIIFSSHQLADVAELSEALIVIKDGKIEYSGTYDTLKEMNKKYRILFNKPVSEAHIKMLEISEVNTDFVATENQIDFKYADGALDRMIWILSGEGYQIVDVIRTDDVLSSFFV